MSSTQSGEGDIRREMIEKDVVDCMVAMPGQLFYSTQIPACLWFLARNKNPGSGWRDRRGEVLFIDARKLGVLVDRTRRELSDADVQRIANTYHAWRGEPNVAGYEDVPGFCRSVSLEDIRANAHLLSPGRYVGTEEAEADEVPFEVKFSELSEKLEEHFLESARLSEVVREALAGVGL